MKLLILLSSIVFANYSFASVVECDLGSGRLLSLSEDLRTATISTNGQASDVLAVVNYAIKDGEFIQLSAERPLYSLVLIAKASKKNTESSVSYHGSAVENGIDSSELKTVKCTLLR